MVHPDSQLAAVPFQFLQRLSRVGARIRQVTEGMETIDMTRPHEHANRFPPPFTGVPIGELILRHVEVHRISYFKPESLPHRRDLRTVEKPDRFEVHRLIGCLIEIAADRHHRPEGVREVAREWKRQRQEYPQVISSALINPPTHGRRWIPLFNSLGRKYFQ